MARPCNDGGMIREIEAVLEEFDRDPSALAAEIVRLRERLAQAKARPKPREGSAPEDDQAT